MSPGALPADLEAFLGSLAACALLASCLAASYRAADRLLGDAAPSVRWGATAVLAHAALSALFWLLAPLGAFRIEVALPAWVALAWAAARARAGEPSLLARLREDVLHARAVHRERLSPGTRVLAALAALLFAPRILRSLVAPPMAWDALTYHLLKAGRWVQAGGHAPEAAPDAWGFYEYFPPLGDVAWAWAMLPTHDDSWLGAAFALQWLSVLLAGYVAARAFGASEDRAALGALVVGLVPGVFEFVTSAYVENQCVALFLLGVAFLTRSSRQRSAGDAVLASAALGALAGTKSNYAPVLVLGLALVALVLVRAEAPPRRRITALLACALVASIALPCYVRAWIEKGSPFYPIPLAVGGRTLLAGNEELALSNSGELARDPLSLSPAGALRLAIDPTAELRGHLGLGPAAPVLLVLGVLGAATLLRRPGLRLPLGFMLPTTSLLVATMLGDEYRGLWGLTPGLLGRYLAPSLAAFVVLATLRTERASRALLVLSAGIQLLLAVPRGGWSRLDLRATAEVLLVLALPALLALAAFRLGRARPRLAATLAALLISVASVPQARLRRFHRHRFYESASVPHRTGDVHPLDPRFASSWPIWRHFDGAEPRRLAVTAGWANGVWNWYRYPLLGAELQNEVLYVPVTAGGEVIDYRLMKAVLARADFDAWLRRLLTAGIDHVVALAPETIEGRWMRKHPELFVPVVASANGRSQAFRLERAAAARYLGEAVDGRASGG
jgi:hypothetical protein